MRRHTPSACHTLLRLLVAAVLACPAAGQDWYLSLDPWHAAKGAWVGVSVVPVGVDAKGTPIQAGAMGAVTKVGPGEGDVSLIPAEAWQEGAIGPALKFTPERGGIYLLGVTSPPTTERPTNGPPGTELPGNGPERIAHHMKAAAQLGDLGSRSFRRELYQPLEFVPIFTPTRKAPVGTQIFVLKSRGERLVKHPVRVMRPQTGGDGLDSFPANKGEALALQTGESGHVSVPLDAAGLWVVTAEHKEANPEDGAGPINHRASFSFMVLSEAEVERMWHAEEHGPASPVRSLMGYGVLVVLGLLLVGPLVFLIRGLRR